MIGRQKLADIARPANQKMPRILRMPASVSFVPQSRSVIARSVSDESIQNARRQE
jgi:hypothetical protein